MPYLNKITAKELEKIPFFYDLQGSDLKQVSDTLSIRRLNINRYVFKEGDEANSMYFILEGSVKVLKRNSSGSEDLLANLSAPQILGEMALIDKARRYVSAVTLSDFVAAELKCDDFERFMSVNPETAVNIIRKIAHTLSIKLKKSGSNLYF